VALKQQRIELARVPRGIPVEEDFRLVEAEVPEPAEGQFLGRVVYLSLDPYLRSAIAGRHPGHDACRPGDLVPGRAVAEVVRSRHPALSSGDFVLVASGWQEYCLSDGAGVRRIEEEGAPLSAYLGVLGMPGLTAWAGVTQLLRPRAAETVVVSAATGPVGGTAGQIAKRLGCRVVGIAGSAAKCAHAVAEFAFDACVNHKEQGFRAELAAACPDRIAAYFDNVGGAVLEAVISELGLNGRIALCGLIDQYNTGVPYALPLAPVIAKRARLMGLVVYDYESRYAEFLGQALGWLREGRLRYLEDRAQGLAAAPLAFRRLMSGQNFGKSLVVVGEERRLE
jgi:hypothetical protein